MSRSSPRADRGPDSRTRHARSLLVRGLLALACLVALEGCAGGHARPADCARVETARGVSLSPQGISLAGLPADPAALRAFYAEVGSIEGGAVLWNGAWRDDALNGSDAGTVPAAAVAVAHQAASTCFVPVAVFGWRAGSTPLIKLPANLTNDWSNAEARRQYTSMLQRFAAAEHPPFAFLGNENDFYYEQAPGDYANWLTLYNQTYDAIKAVSPTTQVGPVFNYEHLAGVGALNGWTTAHWQALDAHDLTRIDVVGLTLYPFFSVPRADLVPADYLAPLFARIGAKPIAVTETGWPAEDLGSLNPPWTPGEQAQLEYAHRFFALLDGHEVRLVTWLFLNQLQGEGSSANLWRIFGSIALRDAAGNKRPVYEAWTTR